MDARKFVVGNVAPIGCIPYQKSVNQLKDNQCVDLANKLALQYNARLKDLLLVEMKDTFKDAHFVYANVYDLVMDLIVNFKDYGKKHITHSRLMSFSNIQIVFELFSLYLVI